MSTPDPHTEAAAKELVEKWFERCGINSSENANSWLWHGDTTALVSIANDALTTEAARVRAETWREAAKQVAFYNCDHNHGVAATKACDDLEDQFLRQASNPTATTQPTWSTARPTVAGWYWLKRESFEPCIVEVLGDDVGGLTAWFTGDEMEHFVESITGEWCPIARPGEREG